MFDRSSISSSSSTICRLLPFLGVIVIATFTAPSPAFAEQACRPKLAISLPQMSEMRGVRRTWRAQLAADATACADSSGRFAILFTRLLEYGPDADFVETFTWREGVSEIELELSLYEAVSSYWIHGIETCSCRR